MTTGNFQRKLTAILSADVVGYSSLMGDNEEATVRTLKKYKEMIFRLIERHNGRLVDSPGDNVLADFASIVDAVRCAVQIQEDLKVNNEELPPNRKMEFRIGINTGDVIQDGDRIYGDGVNIAARIESLADPGGICLSRTAYDQVKKKLNYEYEYLGEYEVKNIDEPVQIYRVQMELETPTKKVNGNKTSSEAWRKIALAVVTIFILGTLTAWYFSFRQTPVVIEVKEGPKTIAVLPFVDLSPEKDQEYFSDGLTEELINKLAQMKDLQVTARTSSFYFKGKNVDMRTIGEKLGVAYVLEGSVRKSENQLRITAQLIKAVDGYHLWSETYDCESKDIFTLEDDIVKAVTTVLSITLGVGEFARPGVTHNFEAYDLYLRAYSNILKFTPDSILEAIDLVKHALDIDPDSGLGWLLLS